MERFPPISTLPGKTFRIQLQEQHEKIKVFNEEFIRVQIWCLYTSATERPFHMFLAHWFDQSNTTKNCQKFRFFQFHCHTWVANSNLWKSVLQTFCCNCLISHSCLVTKRSNFLWDRIKCPPLEAICGSWFTAVRKYYVKEKKESRITKSKGTYLCNGFLLMFIAK